MPGIFIDPGEDVHYRSAEIGYFLGEEYWGQGIMSEILPAVVDWAFAQFDGEEGGVGEALGLYIPCGRSE